jgi:hypothetical protein
MKSTLYIGLLAVFLGLAGCENYLGDKTDLGFIEVPEFTNRDVAYVPIQPALTNFIRPVDLCIGFDELLYVVDEATEEVVCLDESGREIARKYVQGAKSVSQDRRFNLLVIGTKTDTVAGVAYDLSCIYRLELAGDDGYGLQRAQVVNTIVHPFYFKSTFSSGDALVEFHKVGIVGDNFDPNNNNAWYVTRTGPSANNAGLGPDDAVVLFNNNDVFESAVLVTTSGGQFNNYFREPSGLVTRTQPPQITAGQGKDFIVSSLSPNNLLKVQYIEFQETEFGAQYSPRIFPIDTSLADGFISEPNKFTRPVHLCLTGDGTNYLFVTDAEKDSLYQFTLTGLEGVAPPPASGETRYQKASFGGTGIGLTQFNEPMGVAYWREILYVCDAGNGRVLRFKLTLDFE